MRRAAFFCFLNAALAIPVAFLSADLTTQIDNGMIYKATDIIISTLLMLLTFYLLLLLKRLLNDKYFFRKIDRLILLSISIQSITWIIGVLSDFLPDNRAFVALLLLAAAIITGTIYTAMGMKLAKLGNNLYGLLKPFCAMTVLTGVASATVFFYPIVYISSMLMDILLGVIFLREAKADREKHNRNQISLFQM